MWKRQSEASAVVGNSRRQPATTGHTPSLMDTDYVETAVGGICSSREQSPTTCDKRFEFQTVVDRYRSCENGSRRHPQ